MREKFWIGHIPGYKGEYDSFKQWPDHITIVPPAQGSYTDVLNEKLEKICSEVAPIRAVAGKEDLFGENKNMRVRAVRNSIALTAFRYCLVAEIEKMGHKVSDGFPFNPHISGNNGEIDITEGEILTIDHLTVVSYGNECDKRIIHNLMLGLTIENLQSELKDDKL